MSYIEICASCMNDVNTYVSLTARTIARSLKLSLCTGVLCIIYSLSILENYSCSEHPYGIEWPIFLIVTLVTATVCEEQVTGFMSESSHPLESYQSQSYGMVGMTVQRFSRSTSFIQQRNSHPQQRCGLTQDV